MAKAKKLPSGMWRVQVYSHTDPDGKKHRESFTAATKAEAEMRAAEFAANKSRRARNDLTVGEALDGYINAKEGVLSPSTIRGYLQLRNIYFSGIENKKIRQLTTEDVQLFVSDLSKDHPPKTVRNIYGLFRPAVSLYAPDVHFRVTLPAMPKKRPAAPSNAEIQAFLDAATPKMKKRLALAMLGLRRGEICAVEYEDIKDGVLHVHRDVVLDRYGKWIYKELPKTSGSDRFVKLPQVLLDMIGEGEGLIVNIKPDALSRSMERLRDKVGSRARLHDMRHFFASTAAVLGIPDIYTADMGGWERNSPVLKSIYQNNMDEMSEYYSEKMAGHMNDLLLGDKKEEKGSHESAHGNEKSP